MLIVNDVFPSQPPSAVDQKTHQILATIKSIKWSSNPSWDINIVQLSAGLFFFMLQCWPDILGVILSSQKVWQSGSLCIWKATTSIFCPFITPVFFSTVVHSSISPFISPSISSGGLCSTFESVCQGPRDAPLLHIHRHLIWTAHLCQIASRSTMPVLSSLRSLGRKSFDRKLSRENKLILTMTEKALNYDERRKK